MRTFHDPEAFARVQRLPADPAAARLRDALARGVDVVDLSTGNPDGAPPPRVVEALRAAAGDARMHRYLDPRGIPELREAAAAWWKRRHGVALDPETEVLATIGTREGIGHAAIALLAPGDALMAPAPAYPAHAHAAVLAGAETIFVPVGPGIDFMESLYLASEKAERRPRGLLVSFPSNPTTATASPELLQKVLRFAEARNLFILSDLAHCDLVFEGRAPAMLELPGAKERTLEFMSLSKSYSMPGWRVGFAAGNPALLAAAARVKSYLDYGAFAPIQIAAVAALNGPQDCVGAMRVEYRKRRDVLVKGLHAAGWNVPSPDASMFLWAPIPDRFRHLGSVGFSKLLLEKAKVAVAPGLGFGEHGDEHVRIALVENEHRIRQALRGIKGFLAADNAGPVDGMEVDAA